MKTNSYIFLMMTSLLVGCKEEILKLEPAGEIAAGERIMFTTLAPDVPTTTRSPQSEWEKLVKSYKAVQDEYTFTVEMWKEGAAAATATSTYKPLANRNAIAKYDGTLELAENAQTLYWQDNVNRWGFKAKSVSSEDVEAEQNTKELWLKQDLLVGHSYLPIWTGDADNGNGTDPNVMQYKTSKQWYADNKTSKELSGLMVQQGSNGDEYKKIPLYMKHQRAWITVILHAGEGVRRDALKFETAAQNITMKINSFKAGEAKPTEINKALASEAFIDYPKDKNGAAQTHVSTTRYDAIVEPHNYATKKDEEVIAKINLSNQNFSFYAGNDSRFLVGHTEEEVAAALNAYNLEAGKHLTIDVTLSRESRKILITAWIEDWTEVATATICDDYGQNGDPVVIKDLPELKAFLGDEKKNKAGSVGLIEPPTMNLDADGDWPSTYNLNATLNLAGCIISTKHQLFDSIASSGNLVNGTVKMTDDASVKCAIANRNDGTIERVDVTTQSGEESNAKATLAGMVGLNCGTIFQCSSTLPVYASSAETIKITESESYTGYIGGIAAVSKASETASMAVIDACTVNASVNGLQDVTIHGGGIVGFADGRVSNNTFEYGISVSQDMTYYKNIFAAAGTLRATGNAWPTAVKNPIGNDEETNLNTYPGFLYDAVIENQHELDLLMQSDRNVEGKNYRISKSFTVESSDDASKDWTHGTVKADSYGADINNVSFNLDGNDKTITLTGSKQVYTSTGYSPDEGDKTWYTTAPMLFNYVLGEIKNLTLYLEQPIVASPGHSDNTDGKDSYDASDAIAPLAYGVNNGKLTNIKVKAKPNENADAQDPEVFVQSALPAGLVAWALGGAVISECKVNVPVRMWLPSNHGDQAKRFAGGIVGCAARVEITQCQYLGNSEKSLTGACDMAKSSSDFFYGGIVGGAAIKNSEKPEIQIADCSSWYITTKPQDDTTDKTSRAAIIAYPCYADNNSSDKITNAMSTTKVSEGNWWQLSSDGALSWISGLTEEKIIGKKNGVEPPYDTDF